MKDVLHFAAAAGYTFVYDVVPGAEFVGGRPEEFAETLGSRAAFEGAGLGHSAAIATGVIEIGGGLLAVKGAIAGGGGAAAAALVPGGQFVTAVGVPAAAVVAVAGAVSAGAGVYTMSKAQQGMERLRDREASIIKESPSKDAAKKEPGTSGGGTSTATAEPAKADPKPAAPEVGPKKESTIVKSQREGARRELETHAELKQEHPTASVQRERYLRDAEGQRVLDPQTGEARRVDHVVIEEARVTRSVETTSPTADKAAQTAKEKRIREAGGNFVRDRETGKIVPMAEGVETTVKRRP